MRKVLFIMALLVICLSVQADKISLATVFDTVVVHNNQYWELKTRSVEYLGNGSKNISTVTYKHNYDYSNLPVLAENTIMLGFDCGVSRSDSLYDNMGRLIKVCDYMNYSYNRDTIFYVDDIKVKLYVPTEDNWILSAQTIFEYENNLLKFKKQCVIDNGTINSHEYTSTTYSYKDDKIVCQLDSQFFDDGSFTVFNKIDYDYYPSGRLESVTYYDYTAENPIKKDIYTYDYDGNKCLSKSVLSISYKDGMFVGNNIEREEYKYDKNGNTTSVINYSFNNSTLMFDKRNIIEYAYDKYDRVVSRKENNLINDISSAITYNYNNRKKTILSKQTTFHRGVETSNWLEYRKQ